jgi:HSP20 family protein
VRRTIELPTGIELERAEATFRNGVLEVHLPRTPEATARRIEVKT